MPSMRALNELSEERMEICRSCNRYDAILNRCRKCGCFLAAKTRFPGARCPVGHWNRDDIRARDALILLRDEREAKAEKLQSLASPCAATPGSDPKPRPLASPPGKTLPAR